MRGEDIMAKKIYIADDEKNIRDLISAFLTNEGYSVEAFSDGDSLFARFAEKPADLVILDVMMSGTDGFMISSEIRKISNVPIIIVSARDSEIDRITGISLGSDDYLTKPFSPMELVARVKAIFRRIELDSGVSSPRGRYVTFSDLSADILSREVYVGDVKLDLSPTEFALVLYLAERSDRAVSREELLRNVWKFDFDVDTRATDDVIKRLRKKLNAADSGTKIESVWGFGFRLAEKKE